MFKLPKITFGDYPAEYNPKVHGPYDPSRYYGKPDTPFSQVKLGDLKSWFARRNKSPLAMMRAISRAHWRWQHNYVLPKKSNGAYICQWALCGMILYYAMNYQKTFVHRHHKYH